MPPGHEQDPSLTTRTVPITGDEPGLVEPGRQDEPVEGADAKVFVMPHDWQLRRRVREELAPINVGPEELGWVALQARDDFVDTYLSVPDDQSVINELGDRVNDDGFIRFSTLPNDEIHRNAFFHRDPQQVRQSEVINLFNRSERQSFETGAMRGGKVIIPTADILGRFAVLDNLLGDEESASRNALKWSFLSGIGLIVADYMYDMIVQDDPEALRNFSDYISDISTVLRLTGSHPETEYRYHNVRSLLLSAISEGMSLGMLITAFQEGEATDSADYGDEIYARRFSIALSRNRKGRKQGYGLLEDFASAKPFNPDQLAVFFKLFDAAK